MLILAKPDLLDEMEAKKIQDAYPDIIPPIDGFWVGFVKTHLNLIPKDYRELVLKYHRKF